MKAVVNGEVHGGLKTTTTFSLLAFARYTLFSGSKCRENLQLSWPHSFVCLPSGELSETCTGHRPASEFIPKIHIAVCLFVWSTIEMFALWLKTRMYAAATKKSVIVYTSVSKIHRRERQTEMWRRAIKREMER